MAAILGRSSYGTTRKRQRRPSEGSTPLAAISPSNDRWCVDFKGPFRTGGGRTCCPVHASSMLIRNTCCDARLWTTLMVVTLSGYLIRTSREYGLPRAIRSHNGPPFASVAPAVFRRFRHARRRSRGRMMDTRKPSGGSSDYRARKVSGSSPSQKRAPMPNAARPGRDCCGLARVCHEGTTLPKPPIQIERSRPSEESARRSSKCRWRRAGALAHCWPLAPFSSLSQKYLACNTDHDDEYASIGCGTRAAPSSW